jgi:hypothetical protein
MPQSLVLAVGAGIGLFIAWVLFLWFRHLFLSPMLVSSASVSSPRVPSRNWRRLIKVTTPDVHIAGSGLGVIGGNTTNLVGLGGCTPDSESLQFFENS